jgi:ubiquinone/menaquinone biosynthesis C-methylase UbiE/DNA-binding transcriptional ArsR family regulator
MSPTSATSAAHSAVQGCDADALATLLKAAGDPLRLQILHVLSSDAFGALELSTLFSMRQNAMSHHLKLLSAAGLLASRREGTHLFYQRNRITGPFRALCEALFESANQIILPAEIQRQLDDIHRQRSDKSQAFFRANADKFRQQQDLIASYPQYGETVLKTLDNEPAPESKTVLEVGPGEGELLPGLHARFGRVIALDNSAAMLARAKKFAAEKSLDGILFLEGDTASPALADIRANVITLNMVLHHTPTPPAIIRDLAKHLIPGGLLLVTELCHHDQDWAREACGDLWLGFEPEELAHWAQQANLIDTGSEFFALKNGFTIQLRQFRQPDRVAGLRSKKGNSP